MLESAELGKGDKGRRYLFHEPPEERRRWRDRLALSNRPEGYTFELDPRDESGFRALGEIKANAINSAANALAQSADHVKSFFTMLRLELAFYLGCLNLHRWLERKRQPTCFPEPLPHGRPMLAAHGLYDVCLTLHLEQPVVANEVNADHKSLVMVTGANQGGKSTLLRSLGLAQLMMQSGMFVGAESYRANVSTGVFTHYKREEDLTMEGGKLDEELARMSEIADRIAPGALLLCNESFASTNEREGSEIARQVIRAMLDRRITVVSSSPTCTTSLTVFTSSSSTTPCSYVPSAGRTGGARSSCSSAHRSPPATARIPTGASSAIASRCLPTGVAGPRRFRPRHRRTSRGHGELPVSAPPPLGLVPAQGDRRLTLIGVAPVAARGGRYSVYTA